MTSVKSHLFVNSMFCSITPGEIMFAIMEEIKADLSYLSDFNE